MIGKLFSYVDTAWNDDRTIVSFRYIVETDEKSFELEETLELPVSAPNNELIEQITRSIHLALGISYYKAFIPPELTHPYAMDENEAAFWNSVYRNGLGEFLFKNQLPADKLAQFHEQKGKLMAESDQDLEDTALLGIGGGKDSIVAGELLKAIGLESKGFVLATGETLGQAKAVADIMNIPMQPIKRQLDLQILDINKMEGSYNGHVPISLTFALTGCLLAACESSKYVIVANESSASIPQVKWGGQNVNHQWSKSLDFEVMFQKYVHDYISTDMQYFSAIRPLSSLAIAKIFSKYPQYFEVFTSDNSVFKIKQGQRTHPRWSTDSPKSLSSYILLAPYLSDDELMQTFGRDFLDMPELEELFVSLLGRSNTPILDCVGTPDELLYSLQVLHNANRFSSSALMKKAVAEGLFNRVNQVSQNVKVIDTHAIPEKISKKLISEMEKNLS